MRFNAATVSEPNVIEVREYNKPELASQDWLLKVKMVGICGTDHHMISSRKPFPWEETIYPFIPGHEFVGEIEETGSDFSGVDAQGLPLKKGDYVTARPIGKDSVPCGKCYYCMNGMPMFCPARVPINHPMLLRGFQRAYAECRYMHSSETIYKLPEDMPSEVAVLTEPLAVAIHAFERASDTGSSWLFRGMGPGKTVVIQGSGTIGILLTIMAKILGAWKIIVVGAPDNRLALCREFGADETISIERLSTPEERTKAVKELTSYKAGADVVIEAAGVPNAFVEALEMVRSRGTIVEVGHFTDRGTAPINPFQFCAKAINIFGVWGGGPGGFLWAERILERNWHTIPFQKIVTHKFPLAKVKEALEISRKLESMKTVLMP